MNSLSKFILPVLSEEVKVPFLFAFTLMAHNIIQALLKSFPCY